MMFPENTPWCEKHRASCFLDVKGQDVAIDKVDIKVYDSLIGEGMVVL